MNSRLSCGSLLGTTLNYLAHNDFINILRVNPSSLHCFFDHKRAQIDNRYFRKSAAIFSDSCSCSSGNNNFPHIIFPLPTQHGPFP